MKNHISDAIFETHPDGKKTIQTWVYSVLLIIVLVFGTMIILGTTNKTPPEDNRKVVRLALQGASSIEIITTNAGLSSIEVIQKAPTPDAQATQGATKRCLWGTLEGPPNTRPEPAGTGAGTGNSGTGAPSVQ